MNSNGRHELEQWLSVEEFDRLYRELSPNDPAEYFRRPENQWLRDAFIANSFSKLIGAEQVRLVPRPATRPDFEASLRGEVLQMEATEAMPLGRKRGDEYRVASELGYPMQEIPEQELWARRLAIPIATRSVIQNKLGKAYAPGISLVVYVNIGTFDFWREEIERDLMQCLAEASDTFEHVYAIWSGRLYTGSSSGQ